MRVPAGVIPPRRTMPILPPTRACARAVPRGAASEWGRWAVLLGRRRRPHVHAGDKANRRLRRARLLSCFFSGPRSDANGTPLPFADVVSVQQATGMKKRKPQLGPKQSKLYLS